MIYIKQHVSETGAAFFIR